MVSFETIEQYFDKLEEELQKYARKFVGKNADKQYWGDIFEAVRYDLSIIRKRIKEFDDIHYREMPTEEISGSEFIRKD